jgi:hypothetical protein
MAPAGMFASCRAGCGLRALVATRNSAAAMTIRTLTPSRSGTSISSCALPSCTPLTGVPPPAVLSVEGDVPGTGVPLPDVVLLVGVDPFDGAVGVGIAAVGVIAGSGIVGDTDVCVGVRGDVSLRVDVATATGVGSTCIGIGVGLDCMGTGVDLDCVGTGVGSACVGIEVGAVRTGIGVGFGVGATVGTRDGDTVGTAGVGGSWTVGTAGR